MAVVIVLAACSSGSSSDKTAPARKATVQVVSQNLLHGIACPAATHGSIWPAGSRCSRGNSARRAARTWSVCRRRTRGRYRYCGRTLPRFAAATTRSCGTTTPASTAKSCWTSLPVLGWRRIRLAGPLRTALWVRVAAPSRRRRFRVHPPGQWERRPPVRPHHVSSPVPRSATRSAPVRDARSSSSPRRSWAPIRSWIVGGDLNAKPGEPAIAALLGGGFTDTHLAAGNPECNTTSGAQCTSGRVDDALTDMTDPSSRQSERIDYLFVGGRRACKAVKPTGLFNAQPATPGPDRLVFPADHTGVEATLSCETTTTQEKAATKATVTSVPTTTGGRHRVRSMRRHSQRSPMPFARSSTATSPTLTASSPHSKTATSCVHSSSRATRPRRPSRRGCGSASIR